MNELTIREHNFQRAKKQLTELLNQTKMDLSIKKVDNSAGPFGIFDYRVKGEDLNEITSQIQKHLQKLNNVQITSYKQIDLVRQALESLDKDYYREIRDCIRGIQNSISIAKENSRAIQDKQQQITKIANDQKTTLVELVKFKKKVDGYIHLRDIDRLWSDSQTYFRKVDKLRSELNESERTVDKLRNEFNESQKTVDTLRSELNESEKTVDELFRLARRLGQQLESILAVTRDLERLNHWKDVDIIWKETKDHQLRIQKGEQQNASHEKQLHTLAQTDVSLRQGLNANAAAIQQLQEYRETLNELTHLMDIDRLWQLVEEQDSQLKALGKRGDELAAAMHQGQDEVKQNLATALEKYQGEVDQKLTTTLAQHQRDVKTLTAAFEKNKGDIDQKLTTALAQNQEKVGQKLAAALQKNQDEVDQKVTTALVQNQGEVEKKLATSLAQHQGEVNQKLTTALAQNRGEVDQKLADALQAANTTVESLSQKVKQAYWIAGGSAVLAGASLVVLLMKVM